MIVERPTTPDDLAVSGEVDPDGAGLASVAIRLVIGAAIRRAGHGTIRLEVHGDALVVERGELVWLVTTNKGWAHLRGSATTDDGRQLPFRADLYSAAAVDDPGRDRVALRLYAQDADPNLASPAFKLYGWLPHGSVALGRPG